MLFDTQGTPSWYCGSALGFFMIMWREIRQDAWFIWPAQFDRRFIVWKWTDQECSSL